MAKTCNVCQGPLGKPIFESRDTKSITTMNALINGSTTVYFCRSCQHCQTDELPDLDRYYSTEYEINLKSEDEDQLYAVVDGKEVYRAEHQALTLMSKIDLARHRRVLDYGCAKASSLRTVCTKMPDIKPYLYDVTDKYVPFWETFPVKAHWATGKPHPEWRGQIDVVLSFYALEHTPALSNLLSDVRSLLVDGGYFYFIVPNVYQNAADFVVADHVNHFSRESLWFLMANNGFSDIEVDDRSHASAFIVTARRAPDDAAKPVQPKFRNEASDIQSLASFWRMINTVITEFEASLPPEMPLMIYGAGFYGNYILSSLEKPKRVVCFLDQNPFLQGSEIAGVPVIHPREIPDLRAAVLVGLNPSKARQIIREIPELSGRDDLTFLYLS